MADERVLKVRVEGDTTGLDAAAKGAEGRLDGLGSKLGGLGKAAAVGGVAAVGALGAVGAGLLSTIGPAEALGDAQARVGLVFGEATAKMVEDQSKVASSLGLSKTAYLDQVGALGQLGTSLGLSGDEAAKMASGFTELGPQLAAYAGVEGDVAASALEAALKGKTKALAGLGIAITDADQAGAAMRLGIQGEKKDWTEAQLAQVNYEAVMAKTTNAQKAWADNSGDVEVSMQRIGAAVENAQASIGQKLLPILAPLIEKLAAELPGAIDKVMGVLGPMFQFLTENPAIAMLVAGLGAVAGVVGTVMAVAAPFLPVVMGIVGGLGSLAGVAGTVVSAIGGLAVLFNPITLAIGLVVAAVVGLKLAWDSNLGGIQEKTAAAWAAVQAAFDSAVAAIGSILTTLGSLISTSWNQFYTTITTALGLISTAVTTSWTLIWSTIVQWLNQIWTEIQGKWDAILREISEKLAAILGKVVEVWTGVQKTIADAMAAVFAAIHDLWEQARAAVDSAVSAVRGYVESGFKVVHDVVDSVMRFVGDYISSQIDFARRAVDVALGLISTAFSTILGGLKAIVEGAMRGVTSAFDVLSGIATTVQGYLDSIVTTLTGWATTALASAKAAGAAVVQGIVDGINGALGFVQTAISTLSSLIPQWLRDALGWHSPATISIPAGMAVAEGLAVGIESGFDIYIKPAIGIVADRIAKLLARRPIIPEDVHRSIFGGPHQRGPAVTPRGRVNPNDPTLGPIMALIGAGPLKPDSPAIRALQDLGKRKLNQTTKRGKGGFRFSLFDENLGDLRQRAVSGRASDFPSVPGGGTFGGPGFLGGDPRMFPTGGAKGGQITGPVQFSGTLSIPITVDGKTLTTLQRTGAWNIARNRGAA